MASSGHAAATRFAKPALSPAVPRKRKISKRKAISCIEAMTEKETEEQRKEKLEWLLLQVREHPQLLEQLVAVTRSALRAGEDVDPEVPRGIRNVGTVPGWLMSECLCDLYGCKHQEISNLKGGNKTIQELFLSAILETM